MTPKYYEEHWEVEVDAQGTEVRRTQRHHTGPTGDWASGLVWKGGGGG